MISRKRMLNGKEGEGSIEAKLEIFSTWANYYKKIYRVIED